MIKSIETIIKKKHKYYLVTWEDGTSKEYPYNYYSVNIQYNPHQVVPYNPIPHKGCVKK